MVKKCQEHVYVICEGSLKSARFQLENWDAQAQLGSQPSQLGKFQLEPITKFYILSNVFTSLSKNLKTLPNLWVTIGIIRRDLSERGCNSNYVHKC